MLGQRLDVSEILSEKQPSAGRMIFLLIGVAGLALWIFRRRAMQAAETLSARRLPVGKDGIIPGAEGFLLRGSSGAVLLLHGFGDTPQTLRELGGVLNADGWTVLAPLLPGHGGTLPEFARSNRAGWEAAARNAYHELRTHHPAVCIVGLSMGGALAARLAADEDGVSALVLIAPYLRMPARISRAASMHWLLPLFAPYVGGRPNRSIHDPAARERSLGFGVTTPRLVWELREVARRGREALPRLRVPTLMLQSREDNRIAPSDAAEAFASIGAPVRELVWLEGCGHVITVDIKRDRVFAATRAWLRRHGRLGVAARPAVDVRTP
jgi:carboxylesterase